MSQPRSRKGSRPRSRKEENGATTTNTVFQTSVKSPQEKDARAGRPRVQLQESFEPILWKRGGATKVRGVR